MTDSTYTSNSASASKYVCVPINRGIESSISKPVITTKFDIKIDTKSLSVLNTDEKSSKTSTQKIQKIKKNILNEGQKIEKEIFKQFNICIICSTNEKTHYLKMDKPNKPWSDFVCTNMNCCQTYELKSRKNMGNYLNLHCGNPINMIMCPILLVFIYEIDYSGTLYIYDNFTCYPAQNTLEKKNKNKNDHYLYPDNNRLINLYPIEKFSI